jgi:succinyl-diaminopimelate desuccinylase
MRAISFGSALDFARDLIRIPSPPGGEGAVAERVIEEMQALGFDDVRADAVGNVIGIVSGRDAAAPTVMLSSHLDVVDVGDADAWEYPPFGAVVAAGHLHGRGAMDIKGPLAIQTYAAAACRERGMRGDIIVAHTVLEERGGWGMEHLMETGEVRPAAVIIGEATHGDICIGHRGRAELIIEIEGVAGHASAPERARSPLDALPSLVPALRDFAAALDEMEPLGRSTAVATAIETLPRSRNVIPDRVRVVIDWRVLPGMTASAAVDRLERFLRDRVELGAATGFSVRSATEAQTTWTGLHEQRAMFTPGYLIAADHVLVQAAAAAIEIPLGRAPAIRPWTFATDGGHSCGVHGVPTIGFAPGEERFAHTNRERLELREAEAVYEAYPALIEAIGGAVARSAASQS